MSISAPKLRIQSGGNADNKLAPSTGKLRRYTEFRTAVADALANALATPAQLDTTRIHHLLNGGASVALQQYVTPKVRSEFGIFFSGEALASSVASRIESKLLQGAVLSDPACGAGDLLLACLARMPLQADFKSTLNAWGTRVSGLDIHGELAAVAQQRMALLAASRLHMSGKLVATDVSEILREPFMQVAAGDFFERTNFSADADCVVMNPPFTETDSPKDCTWSSGKVQQAAVFAVNVLNAAKVGQEIVAVLPDVLRSGSRYGRWRKVISESAEILAIDLYGRFDTSTDVDVFILHLRKQGSPNNRNKGNWSRSKLGKESASRQKRVRVSDLFEVSVGALVPHRHKKGNWMPFLDVSISPPDAEVLEFKNHRFEGTLHKGPFVVVRRTSSPSDERRAIGSLVRTSEYIAVENHLLVLQPRDGKLETCRKLIVALKNKSVDVWLNRRIRCRHLTTRSISDLPLRDWQ